MTLRRYVDAARRRQPFASRSSLEATAAGLRHEVVQLQSALDALRAEVAGLRSDLDALRTEVTAVSSGVDAQARTAWNELAARTEAWGAHLLALEQALAAGRPVPGGAAHPQASASGQ
jgi:phage shock protein A